LPFAATLAITICIRMLPFAGFCLRLGSATGPLIDAAVGPRIDEVDDGNRHSGAGLQFLRRLREHGLNQAGEQEHWQHAGKSLSAMNSWKTCGVSVVLHAGGST
jgi:hypothetical protein